MPLLVLLLLLLLTVPSPARAQTATPVTNPGFETGGIDGWWEWHPAGQRPSFGVDGNQPRSGARKLYFWNERPYRQSVHQDVVLPAAGSWRFTAWVRLRSYSGAAPAVARMELTPRGGVRRDTNFAPDPGWRRVDRVITVAAAGPVDLGFYLDAAGFTSLEIDDVEVSPAALTTYTTPGAAASHRFSVHVLHGEERRASFVHQSIVPAKTYPEEDGADRTRPRSLSWTTFAFTDAVTVEVRRSTPFERAVVRPASAGISARRVDDRTLRFTVDRSMSKLAVEFDGDPSHALLVFADAPEDPATVVAPGSGVYTHAPGTAFNPPAGTTAVRFGPGEHNIGYWVVPRTVTRVYLAGGAVVYGAVHASTPGFRLTGRGVLSGARFPWRALKRTGAHHTGECWVTCIKMVELDGVTDGLIDGVTIADPPYYTITPGSSRRVDMRNLKVVGGWRWNSDGAELPPSSKLTDCFIHANDDAIKAYQSDLTVSRCVVWKGPNGPLVQTGWDVRNMARVHISDIDVIHVEGGGYRGATNTGLINHQYDPETLAPSGTGVMSDIVFEDIRSEEPTGRPITFLAPPGQVIRGVTVRNLAIPAFTAPDAVSMIGGFGGGRVEDVLVENLRIGGVRVTDANTRELARIQFDAASTSGITFR